MCFSIKGEKNETMIIGLILMPIAHDFEKRALQ